CAGQSYTLPTGLIVTSTGVYRDTLKSVLGCDSLITVVSVKSNPVITNNISRLICAGQTYTLPSGVVVSATGFYRDTIRYRGVACDSLRTNVNLVVQQVTRVNKNVTLCIGQSYTMPTGVVVSTTGIYTDTLRYGSGCDSIITRVAVL